MLEPLEVYPSNGMYKATDLDSNEIEWPTSILYLFEDLQSSVLGTAYIGITTDGNVFYMFPNVSPNPGGGLMH